MKQNNDNLDKKHTAFVIRCLNKEMDELQLPDRYKEFFIRYYNAKLMTKQHVVCNFLNQHADLSPMEKHHTLCEIMGDFSKFTEASIRERVIEITDKWEDTWLNMSATARKYYFGNNPLITSAFALMV